ncbi:perosamine synthetase [Halopelagius inordinatus]|uniref:Perosamine synthetase n=1 Tax=Halopelagius inordinatus TaxID=553467 RepID=A0A1I2PUQ8_9EURY|nr:DegT/DnrJ/EryC1/StrS family aminotransferase [Halopelagius inordinatus]SFG17346.1 perosamine synthetase [Halopelagius inordinatus]
MIPVAEPWITDHELDYVTDCVERAWISPKGNYVEEFEDKFASFVGTEYAFATSSGTSALHLSLVAADIGPGDEVIVPDLTWIACGNVVEFCGADPVFVDVTAETFTLDPQAVKDAITDSTAAIMPVHLYGHPSNMEPLLDIADEHDLFVVEDAAEAHGAEYRGSPVGSIGDVGCFSFYGNKILTTGQGGMITTDDDELADLITLYRRDGMSRDRKYYHEVVGYNYRLTNMQAAVGVAQVERADEILEEKRRVAETYREKLADAPVRFQSEPDWSTPTYWMNAPVFESAEVRNAVVDALEDADVETRPLFYPLHDQPPYRGRNRTSPTTSVDLYARGMNLPSGPLLKTDEIEVVCRAVLNGINNA